MMAARPNVYFFVGAAVVGVVSAAGLFIIEHFRQERRRHAMVQNLARMDQQLSGMQKELEQLRKLQKEKNAVRIRKRKAKSTMSTVSNETKTVGEDSSDLEFYDVSDDDETTATVTPIELTLQLLDEKLNDDSTNFSEVLEQLTDLCYESPEDPRLLWRIGKAHYKLASKTNDLPQQNIHVQNGITACQSALNVDPRTGDAHKWMGAFIGLRCEHRPIKEKISDGFLSKEHLDKAIELLPNDSAVHHMLGRFIYECANLKWYERKAAAAFFGEPPQGTFEEALEYFLKAEQLSKTDWKENKLFIAKTQIALQQYKEAVATLKAAQIITDSAAVDSEVDVLLQKYNSYS